MAKPSFSAPDDLLEEFDDEIWNAKVQGDLDREVDRSQVLRDLMRLWLQSRGIEIEPENRAIVDRLFIED